MIGCIKNYVEDDPDTTITLFYEIHQQANLSEWFYGHDEAYNILRIGASNSDKTKEIVLSIIDSLKRRGYNLETLNSIYFG